MQSSRKGGNHESNCHKRQPQARWEHGDHARESARTIEGGRAVEGLSLPVATEVEQFGIKITVAEPGFFRTGLLDARNVRWSRTVITPAIEARLRATRAYEEVSKSTDGSF
jgi:hypothetical protein